MQPTKTMTEEDALQIMMNFIEKAPMFDDAQKAKLRENAQKLYSEKQLAALLNKFNASYAEAETNQKFDIISQVVIELLESGTSQSAANAVMHDLADMSLEDIKNLPDSL